MKLPGRVPLIALATALAAAAAASAATAAPTTVSFTSDTTWLASDADAATGPALALPAPAQKVCMNATSPPSCPPDATLYGFTGSGWGADLSSIPGAAWIWAPGITGSTSQADLDQYGFSKTFDVAGRPTAGTIAVAADDFAEVSVNGSVVGSIGSTTDATAASSAQASLTSFDITAFLTSGSNTITVRGQNGPSSFAGCSGSCTYAQNVAGVVFGGSFSYEPPSPPPPAALTVSKTGSGAGTVTSAPAGIDCGSSCQAAFAQGSVVTLTATAAAGSQFSGWSGACSGLAACVVTMDQARSVTAGFALVPQPAPQITAPPSVPAAGLFCGVKHRGKCTGLTIKTEFSGPGNAVWQFAAYNPSPGHTTARAAAKKLVVLGKLTRRVNQAGRIVTVFRLRSHATAKRLYRQVSKLHLKTIRIRLSFTTPSGQVETTTTNVKLGR
jgi:hypothetical protein